MYELPREELYALEQQVVETFNEISNNPKKIFMSP